MKKLVLGVFYNLAVLATIAIGYCLTHSLWFGVLLVFMNKNLLKGQGV